MKRTDRRKLKPKRLKQLDMRISNYEKSPWVNEETLAKLKMLRNFVDNTHVKDYYDVFGIHVIDEKTFNNLDIKTQRKLKLEMVLTNLS